MKETMRDMFKLSFGEEVGNAVSHGVMALLCLFVLPFVAVYSYVTGDVWKVVAESVYIICLFLMFLISTIYHSMEFGSNQKYVFRKLDHICIFLAIAGTYTPVLLLVVKGWVGYLMLFLQWAAVLAGILMTAIPKKRYKKIEMAIYLIMGWIAVIILPILIQNAKWYFLALIVLGGVLYTVGIYFYAKKYPYAHFIWHIFIILASISHFIAVVFLI